MPPHTGDIVHVTTPCTQINSIRVKRLSHRDGPAGVPALAILSAAGEAAGPVLCLPIGKDIFAVRLLAIIGEREFLDPVSSLAVRRYDAPCAGYLIAPVSEA